jgi:Zn finger protein HypA/HybF involved in hydrogenase expression
MADLDAFRPTGYDDDMTDVDMTESWPSVRGLIDPYSGALERVLPVGDWLVPPGLKLQDKFLVYDNRPFRLNEEALIAEPKVNILFEFSGLADADDTGILEYARKFGVLGLCEHGKPRGHFVHTPIKDLCTPIGWPFKCREPIERWRFYASGFGALLRLSVALHNGQSGDAQDWKHALKLPRIAEHPAAGPWAQIAGVINLLMTWAGIAPYWVVGGKMSGVELRTVVPACALFGTLTAELLFTITRSRGLLICSDCGRFYLPQHPPPTGSRKFCPKCGNKAARRYASKDYRRREKARGLRRQGWPAPQFPASYK